LGWRTPCAYTRDAAAIPATITGTIYQIDELKIDLARRLVSLQGEEVSLTPTEYDVLRLLVINAGKVLTHRMILQKIWGPTYLEQPHILRVNISNLRHKLEKDASRPRFILTESGVGYRFKSAP
jgi:two-component system, OmpR family, KDP operon response regulator KdpE